MELLRFHDLLTILWDTIAFHSLIEAWKEIKIIFLHSRIAPKFVQVFFFFSISNFIQCPKKVILVFSNPCPAPQPLLGTDRLPVNCQHQLCPTGYWCHFGISSQSTVCCPGVCDPCTSPMNLGQGHSSLQRWYFNSVLGRCEQFIYAGEMGNCNNFLSKPDCQYACPGNKMNRSFNFIYL